MCLMAGRAILQAEPPVSWSKLCCPPLAATRWAALECGVVEMGWYMGVSMVKDPLLDHTVLLRRMIFSGQLGWMSTVSSELVIWWI